MTFWRHLLHWVALVFRWGLLLGLLWELWLFTQVLWWRNHNPESTSFMRIRAEEQHHAIQPHPWVTYDHIPGNLKRAVVAAEDSTFTTHHGFDWDSMRHAFERDVKRRKPVMGGSTITQQLAKNLFLSGHRSLLRKMQEAIITLMLESTWGKRRILEVYLNVIEWGEGGLFGCQAASRHYYGESVASLTLEQSARLAAMIPRPRYFDRHGETERLQEKTDTLEMRMEQVVVPK